MEDMLNLIKEIKIIYVFLPLFIDNMYLSLVMEYGLIIILS